MYAGTTATEHVATEHNVAPGNTALKMKLMSGFCRSIAAANSFPATLQCIFGCMFGMLVNFQELNCIIVKFCMTIVCMYVCLAR